MRLVKLISIVFILTAFISTLSFSQDNKMKEKDMMKKDTNKKEMMKGDMGKKEMMHNDMMMKIDKDQNGIAINGYDPVAYLSDMKPEMGMSKYQYEWMGATWQFASKEHLNMFKKNPEKYTPQFGGYCAYGVSKNKLLSCDPTAFTVDDGRVYLTVDSKRLMLLKKDLKNNIEKAEKNWPNLSKQK
jgi:YHS domain-containing protein